jgi:hypothetical protein
MRSSRPGDDRVLAFTRGLSLFIIPFLLVAFVVLYLFPDDTARLWAWPIPATMSSMVLASAYLGGAYFFVRVLGERHWHGIGTGFLAVALFASLLGVATVLHWDKFLHHHVAFWLWAGLYFVAPFLVVGAWVSNRRYAAPAQPGDAVLRPVERAVVAVVGAVALVQGVVMFLAPSTMIDLWPWPLTPLTCRVMAAVFCLGCAGIVAWTDPRWSSIRLMVQVEVLMLALMLLAALRARDQMIAGRALGWPLFVGTVVIVVGSGWLWVTHERRPGAASPGAGPDLSRAVATSPRSRRRPAGAGPVRARAGRRRARR